MTRLVLIAATLLTAACGNDTGPIAERISKLEARVTTLEIRDRAATGRRVAAQEIEDLEIAIANVERRLASVMGDKTAAQNRIEWSSRSADPVGAKAEAKADLAKAEERWEALVKEREQLVSKLATARREARE